MKNFFQSFLALCSAPINTSTIIELDGTLVVVYTQFDSDVVLLFQHQKEPLSQVCSIVGVLFRRKC